MCHQIENPTVIIDDNLMHIYLKNNPANFIQIHLEEGRPSPFPQKTQKEHEDDKQD